MKLVTLKDQQTLAIFGKPPSTPKKWSVSYDHSPPLTGLVFLGEQEPDEVLVTHLHAVAGVLHPFNTPALPTHTQKNTGG